MSASVEKEETTYKNELTPPLDVSFFNFSTHVMFENQDMGTPPLYTFTWRVDRYEYAINGNPFDPSFSSNGGLIYIIFVHSGVIKLHRDLPNAELQFKVTNTHGYIEPLLQLPRSDSGVQNGDNYDYTIDYSETFQMLQNKGSELFSFSAAYEESFTRNHSKQSGVTEPSLISFTLTEASEGTAFKANSEHEIHAFSLFRATSLSAFPTEFMFEQNLPRTDFLILPPIGTSRGMYADNDFKEIK